jgi:hypothetical protein
MEPVTLENYAARAHAFRNHDLTDKQVLAMLALGLAGETIEMRRANFEQLPAEIGDVYWYAAGICAVCNLAFDELVKFASGFSGEVAKSTSFPSLSDDALFAAGLLAERFKKHLYHGHELDPGIVGEALITLFVALERLRFYCTDRLCVVDILQQNIEKLSARYPGGKFSTERSENREGETDES